MKKYIRWVGKLNEGAGWVAGWLGTVLVVLICYDVAMKSIFNYSSVALSELEGNIFALMFLLGGAYTLKHDRHVRVDLLYNNFSPKRKAWVNLLGVVFFLMPFCFVVIAKSLPYVRNSWLINERSPDPGGLPYFFVMKGMIIVSFVLMILQGIAMAFESALIIARKDQGPPLDPR